MPHFVVLYGGVLMENGELNPDSVGRCKAALRAAKRYSDSVIVYGVGYSIPQLTETTIAYLQKRGWPQNQLVVNPKGYNSLTEAEAAIEILNQHDAREVVVATSWYHVLRVWMIWKLKFRGKVAFSVSWETASPIGSLLREVAGIPKSLLTILLQFVKALPSTNKT